MFNTSKPLLDESNQAALEDLLKGDQGPDLSALYRPLLVRRLTLVRAQLILALSRTIAHYPELPETQEPEGSAQDVPGDPSSAPPPPPERSQEPPIPPLDPVTSHLTLSRLKAQNAPDFPGTHR
ncbi:hypothetical protein GJAV_G00273390 [Gymnothorax javanicus]|nr:hypothetical protein GJAV_G00273390 [Gymnothorax javanicus]